MEGKEFCPKITGHKNNNINNNNNKPD